MHNTSLVCRFHRRRLDKSRNETWRELGEPRDFHCNEMSPVAGIEEYGGLTSVHRTRGREGHRPPEATLGLGLFPDLEWDLDSWNECQPETPQEAVCSTDFHPKGFPGMQWGQGCA